MSQSASLNLPILSPIARAAAQDHNVIYYLMLIAVTVLVLAINAFGWPVLYLAAMALVPVMFAILIWITLP